MGSPPALTECCIRWSRRGSGRARQLRRGGARRHWGHRGVLHFVAGQSWCLQEMLHCVGLRCFPGRREVRQAHHEWTRWLTTNGLGVRIATTERTWGGSQGRFRATVGQEWHSCVPLRPISAFRPAPEVVPAHSFAEIWATFSLVRKGIQELVSKGMVGGCHEAWQAAGVINLRVVGRFGAICASTLADGTRIRGG